MKNLNVVFIHGWLFDSRIWSGLDNEFKGFQSLKLIDLPGYGKNKRLNVNHKDYCRGIFRDIQNKTIIIAWSYGALLVIRAYQEYIDLDVKVVLINANLDISDDDQLLSIKNIDNLISNLKKNKEKAIKNFIFECVKNSKQSKSEFNEIINKYKMKDFPSSKTLINNLNEMKSFHINKNIAYNSDNILCINTDNDQFIDRKKCTYSEVVLDELGHIPFIYGNKKIYQSIIDFI